MVLTDPPYNVAIEGNVSGLGQTRHRDFAMASGEMTREQFTSFLSAAFANLAAHSIDSSIHFICMDWRHIREMLQAGGANYSELKNLIVWAKDNGGMGAFYRSRHELIFAFKNGSAPHINSVELGQHGRYRTNVWEYRGVNTLKAGRAEELALHPTVKPVAMIADAIKDVSKRGGIVLDLFGGSGFAPPQNSMTFPRLAAAVVSLLGSFRPSHWLIGGVCGRKSLAANFRFQGWRSPHVHGARFLTAAGSNLDTRPVRMDGSAPRGKANEQEPIVPYACAGAWSPSARH